jgi:hypothetical protein
MGYRGKIEERERARQLRAESWTLVEIATELGVAKSSVSLWTRDVDFVPRPANRGHPSHKTHPLKLKKQAELERCRIEAEQLVSTLSHRDLTMFCLGLYAGEGSKRDGTVSMANTNPTLIRLMLQWLRTNFEIDESRMRCKIYLHEGLDLEAATSFWREVTDIPLQQFRAPYRAEADGTRRHAKHINGCATVMYSCTRTHRRLLAMIEAVSSAFAFPG